MHVFDEDSSDQETLRKHDFLGMAMFSVSDVLRASGRTVAVELGSPKVYMYTAVAVKKEKEKGVMASRDMRSTRVSEREVSKGSVQNSAVINEAARDEECSSERTFRDTVDNDQHQSDGFDLDNETGDVRCEMDHTEHITCRSWRASKETEIQRTSQTQATPNADADGNEHATNTSTYFHEADSVSLERATCTHRTQRGLTGTLKIRGELLQSLAPRHRFSSSDTTVTFDVRSALIKERSTTPTATLPNAHALLPVTQFYEIHRGRSRYSRYHSSGAWDGDIIYRSVEGTRSSCDNTEETMMMMVGFDKLVVLSSSSVYERDVCITCYRRRVRSREGHDVVACMELTWDQLVVISKGNDGEVYIVSLQATFREYEDEGGIGMCEVVNVPGKCEDIDERDEESVNGNMYFVVRANHFLGLKYKAVLR